jgi:hypothetical protein
LGVAPCVAEEELAGSRWAWFWLWHWLWLWLWSYGDRAEIAGWLAQVRMRSFSARWVFFLVGFWVSASVAVAVAVLLGRTGIPCFAGRCCVAADVAGLSDADVVAARWQIADCQIDEGAWWGRGDLDDAGKAMDRCLAGAVLLLLFLLFGDAVVIGGRFVVATVNAMTGSRRRFRD